MGRKLALGRVIEVGLGAISGGTGSISGGSDSIDGESSVSERVFVVGESVNCLKSVSSDERSRSLLSSVSGDVEPKSMGTNCSVVTGKFEYEGAGLSSTYGVCDVLAASAIGTGMFCCSLRVVLRRRREFVVDGSIFKRTPRGGLQNDDADRALCVQKTTH